MNIKTLLNKSVLELHNAGISSPELDVRVLLMAAMAKKDAFVYSHPDFLVTNAQYAKFRRYIRRRKKGEPIAYILGHKEFYGHDFLVNKNVLVPRPESEWLVEKGMEFLSQLSALPAGRQVVSNQLSVLDMGTGSGCIAISIAMELQNSKFSPLNSVKIYAVDSSKQAIAVAKKNSRLLKPVHSTLFLNSNLFSNRRIKNKKFDLIIANLPYVPYRAKIKNQNLPAGRQGAKIKIKESIYFEPKEAIFAGNNGTEIIKIFLLEAQTRLKDKYLILLELDPRNALSLLKFANKIYPTAKINLHKDLAGLDRYLEIRTE